MTTAEEAVTQPVRVNLVFNDRPVRVPYGVTLFDAASWNGIAIDSTCGGHGTCKKCRIRIAEDPPAPSSLDIRAYTPQEIKDGWRLACRTIATQDTQVEVPPLTTRPKAATVGVGRQVILRPAVQKRYLELAEPSLADQASDLERVLAQLDDLEPRAELSVLKTLGRTLREADYKVTAVVVDDVLIAVEPGDTTARRFGIAFDLGTTTVVATLLDLSTGTPGRGGVHAERPAAVRRRRDHQDQRHHDGSGRPGQAAEPGPGDPGRAGPGGLRPGRGRAARGVRGRGGGQRHHDPPGARHRPRAARHGPVHHGDPAVPRGPRGRPGPGRHRAPAGPRGGVPRVRRLRGRRHHGRAAGQRDGPGRPGPAVHRHRHQLRDRAGQPGLAAGHGRAGRAGLRGRRDQVRDAGRRRRHRGGHDDPGRADPEGDRRRRAAGPVRLRPGRRGDRPGPGGPARLLRPVHQRGTGRGRSRRGSRPG